MNRGRPEYHECEKMKNESDENTIPKQVLNEELYLQFTTIQGQKQATM